MFFRITESHSGLSYKLLRHCAQGTSFTMRCPCDHARYEPSGANATVQFSRPHFLSKGDVGARSSPTVRDRAGGQRTPVRGRSPRGRSEQRLTPAARAPAAPLRFVSRRLTRSGGGPVSPRNPAGTSPRRETRGAERTARTVGDAAAGTADAAGPAPAHGRENGPAAGKGSVVPGRAP